MIDIDFKDVMGYLGVELGEMKINDIILKDVYFTPTEERTEITDEGIDSPNKNVTNHARNELLEIGITGTFASQFGKVLDIDFLNLSEIRKNKQLVKLAGTDFDDLDFMIQSLGKLDQGYNFIDYSIVLKEVRFVTIEEFEYDGSLQGRAEFKKDKAKKKKKTEGKAIPFKEDDYSI